MKVNIIKISSLSYLLFIVFNCAGIPGHPGHISESTSKFDNTRYLTMEPAWLAETSTVKMSLFKNSKMPDSLVVLTVVLKGVHHISDEKSLLFNVDGQFFEFSSIDETTKYEYDEGVYSSYNYAPSTNWSSKRYPITTWFLNKINNAQDVRVKILLETEFLEARFSSDFQNARSSFREFYKKLTYWE